MNTESTLNTDNEYRVESYIVDNDWPVYLWVQCLCQDELPQDLNNVPVQHCGPSLDVHL